MPNPLYLFIQPLLSKNDLWSGYLAETAEPLPVPAALLDPLFGAAEWGKFDSRHLWFVPTPIDLSDKEIGRSDSVVHVFRPLPAEHPAAASWHETEEALRQSGAPIALWAAPGNKLPATGTWTHLLISMSHARSLAPYALLGLASRTQIVALDLHSHADLTWAQTNACSLSTAEFLTSRNQQIKKPDVSRLKLIELLGLISRDADTAEIEEIFREQPKLAYSLLRLVNSASVAPRSPVTSFSQAINLLGRRQLQRWLQLLVYADQNDGKNPNPLLQRAAVRGRLIELLYTPPPDPADDIAFMVGTFSLLDALLNLPLGEIVEQLPLPEPVRQALIGHEGPFGKLLQAIIAADTRQLPMASHLLNKLGISPERFTQAQVSALHWAAQIQNATS